MPPKLEWGISLHDPHFLPLPDADRLFAALAKLPWKQHIMRMHGKEIPMPRVYQWTGIAPTIYGERIVPIEWTPETREVQRRVQLATGFLFNSLNINFYRDGTDHIGWHSDGEEERSVGIPHRKRFPRREQVFPNLPVLRQWQIEAQVSQAFWRARSACRAGTWQPYCHARRIAGILCSSPAEGDETTRDRRTNQSDLQDDDGEYHSGSARTCWRTQLTGRTQRRVSSAESMTS
jgi:hypothetical protein